MDLMIILLRTILAYFMIFFVMRIMGKREIGKLSVFDLVISIMLAEIATFIVENPNKSLLEGVAPIVLIVVLQVIMSFITLKSHRIRQLFDGRPSPIIERGHIKRDEMRKQRYTLDDLLQQLKENQIANVADVEFATLEPTGRLSVVTKEEYEHQRKQVKTALNHTGADESGEGTPTYKPVNVRYEGLPLPLIMDGKVQDNNLEKLGKTRFWLKNQIQSKGLTDFKEIFFCSIDHRGYLFIDRKEKEK